MGARGARSDIGSAGFQPAFSFTDFGLIERGDAGAKNDGRMPALPGRDLAAAAAAEYNWSTVTAF